MRYAVGVIGHNVVIDCGTHEEALAYIERMEAAQPAAPAEGLTPHPGEHHDYRMTCARCGEPGYLFVGFHSPGETFRWSEAQPQEATDASP